MPQQVPYTAAQVNTQPTGMPVNPLGSLNLGQNPSSPASNTVMGPYGTPVTPDADKKGFTNANGGHDWYSGQGPGGDFGGQVNKTGQAPVGQDPGSGDALGYARGTPEYRQATGAHQAWIQQNLSAGRTLADLGMTPTRGGGLSNYMSLGSTLIPGQAGSGGTTPTGPVNPATGLPVASTPMPVGGAQPTSMTGTGPGKGTSTPYTGPQMTTNSGSKPLASTGFGAGVNTGYQPISVPGSGTPQQPLTAQKRVQPGQQRPLGSLGLNQPGTMTSMTNPVNTARMM